VAAWFERRDNDDPWCGRQPRYERLVSEGPGRFFLVTRLPSDELVRVQLGRFHVDFSDDWLPPQPGTDGGRP
jgi:hypothetical protein